MYGQISVRTTHSNLGYKVQVLHLSVRHCQVNTFEYETGSVRFGVIRRVHITKDGENEMSRQKRAMQSSLPKT